MFRFTFLLKFIFLSAFYSVVLSKFDSLICHATTYITEKESEIGIDSSFAASRIAMSGMFAQGERLKVISQNIANSNVTATTSNEDPYRRKVIYFTNKFDPKIQAKRVVVEKIGRDHSPFVIKYQPSHPAANEKGYVKYPNVNIIIENTDAKEAQRSFEANVNAFEISKSNQNKIIDLMK